MVRRALGDDVIVLPYTTPGFKLALAASAALKARPRAWGMVWAHHGVVTWGDICQGSYDVMINLVTRAEHFLEHNRGPHGARIPVPRDAAPARPGPAGAPRCAAGLGSRQVEVTTILRGLLAAESGDCDRPHRRVVLQTLADPEMLAVSGRSLGSRSPGDPAPDHRSPHPHQGAASVDRLSAPRRRGRSAGAAAGRGGQYSEDYRAYLGRHSDALPAGVKTLRPPPESGASSPDWGRSARAQTCGSR